MTSIIPACSLALSTAESANLLIGCESFLIGSCGLASSEAWKSPIEDEHMRLKANEMWEAFRFSYGDERQTFDVRADSVAARRAKRGRFAARIYFVSCARGAVYRRLEKWKVLILSWLTEGLIAAPSIKKSSARCRAGGFGSRNPGCDTSVSRSLYRRYRKISKGSGPE